MTEPRTVGDAIQDALEGVIFENPDPRVQRLKGIWEDGRRETHALFEKAKREQYEGLLDYHRKCGTENAEAAARGEAWALTQLLIEERDERIGIIWSDTVMRVSRVLEDIREEREGE